MSYKPLPDCLTIKESEIEGLGLFATEDIPAGTNLGRTHIATKCAIEEVYTNIKRVSAMGMFYNHSDNPNAIKVQVDHDFDMEGGHGYPRYWIEYYNLVTLRDIKAGEEITVKYTFYEI